MRKIFTLLLLIAGYNLAAQQYNNEWIEYNQTYYKFKVAKAGVYRIPKSVLDAAGIGNTQVQFFELWRNGEKVPFYPSVPSGVLPADGYLEFWGLPNDGKADKALYREPDYQHTDKISLITDTATYFLSFNNNQSGLLVHDMVNNVAGNTLDAEPYFMHTTGTYYSNKVNAGFAAVVGEYFYSSSYDKGEFNSSGDIRPSTNFFAPHNNLEVYASGPASTLSFGAAGNALNPRTVKVRVNGTELIDTLMDYFNDVKTTLPLPTSIISGGAASVQFINTSPIGSDRMVVSYVSISYPRQFNFANQKNFQFSLPARPEGFFLEITNFNDEGVPPVLYDLSNGERYVGDKALAGTVRFALAGSASARDLVLINSSAGNVTPITSLKPRIFTNYNDVTNQGDYLIITHPNLYTGSAGNNPIQDYENYRQSTAGGGYKALVADIEELIDQFGFGIKKHPISIRNFIRYARANFTMQPRFVLLIGKGLTYVEYKKHQSDPNADILNLVPTFGSPGSDNLLSAEDLNTPIATTPIGRLSVIHGWEVENYLEKVKEFEQALYNSPNTLADRAWMKNVVHVTGASDVYLGNVLCSYMNEYRKIIEDTLFGGLVSNFCKTSTNPVEQVSSGKLESLFAEGINFLTYFGHSSSTTLEFNIDNPQNYDNQGKYPVFFVNGCNAGNLFSFSLKRLTTDETLSEKFVLSKQRGSIAFVASTHYGIVNYLNIYLDKLYRTISGTHYGSTLGEISSHAMERLLISTGAFDFYARAHAEEITLHGDPALRLNNSLKPDYVIEESSIKVDPAFISIAESSFDLRLKVTNIGMAVADSVTISVVHQYPEDGSEEIYRQKLAGIAFIDSIVLNIPIVSTRDEGLNKITVTIDADLEIDEISESNNTASREFHIYKDEARPVYPHNYAIIKNATQKVYASTANPFSSPRQYVMEMDTTALFNSSLKVARHITAPGGILEFDPGISYQDSTTYYWKVAIEEGNGEYHWNSFSFQYIDDTVQGFGQSHYYQHLESDTAHVSLTESGIWKFGVSQNDIFIRNGVYPTAGNQGAAYTGSVNEVAVLGPGCSSNELIFNVLHPVSLRPWMNDYSGATGLYKSKKACGGGRNYNFMFSYADSAGRKNAMDFLDLIPDGYIVVVRTNVSPGPPSYVENVYIDQWKDDTTYYGPNISLYHKLRNVGMTVLDLFIEPRAINFIYKKNTPEFVPDFLISDGIFDPLTLVVKVYTPDTLAYIKSPVYGPALNWQKVIWDGTSLETPSTDNPMVQVIGIDTTATEVLLYELDRFTRELDLAMIDAREFPYIYLRMRNADSVSLTPFQLKFWRILGRPAPEGALSPNLHLVSRDSLESGEMMDFAIAFKNISPDPFDSLAIKATLLDNNNATHIIPVSRLKPLISGDTAIVHFTVDTEKYPGTNLLYVDVNPDNDQPELHHFNNFLYKEFYARSDKVSPFLDVTFDGRRILNRDIVSARPHIQIKLKDDAKYLLLNDTSLALVQIKFPDGSFRTYNFDGDTLRFTPASSGENNTATIDFNPAFLSQKEAEGDEYELIVRGKDRSNNRSGDVEYRVAFRVINKPMISNLLNYPNPFSSSTAFVFTITGVQIPENIKIQILTVTGKIVREITKEELGPLHIGRNITEFKWDGTDQYGQKLGNGVYLYRVVTIMNGKPMEKYKAYGDDTDKYFTNGYGKMYLMR